MLEIPLPHSLKQGLSQPHSPPIRLVLLTSLLWECPVFALGGCKYKLNAIPTLLFVVVVFLFVVCLLR